ncbi:MAG: hypothetical protein H0W44_09840 [Gammaproteobacteria bacterium]|nr:hypothetical protein [Gammaproteobacteria bacterium]
MRIELLLICILLAPPAVNASKFYYGASIGLTYADWADAYEETELYAIYLNPYSAAFPSIDHKLETDYDRQSLRIFTGYSLSESYALELGWIDLGNSETRYTSDSIYYTDTTILSVIDADASGFYIAPIAILPISPRSHVALRGGILNWRLDVEEKTTTSNGLPAIPEPINNFPIVQPLEPQENIEPEPPNLYKNRSGLSPFFGIEYHHHDIILGWHYYVLNDGNVNSTINNFEVGYQF